MHSMDEKKEFIELLDCKGGWQKGENGLCACGQHEGCRKWIVELVKEIKWEGED